MNAIDPDACSHYREIVATSGRRECLICGDVLAEAAPAELEPPSMNPKAAIAYGRAELRRKHSEDWEHPMTDNQQENQ